MHTNRILCISPTGRHVRPAPSSVHAPALLLLAWGTSTCPYEPRRHGGAHPTCLNPSVCVAFTRLPFQATVGPIHSHGHTPGPPTHFHALGGISRRGGRHHTGPSGSPSTLCYMQAYALPRSEATTVTSRVLTHP